MQNCCIFWGYFFKKYFFVEKLRQLKKMLVVHQKQNRAVLLHMS